MNLNGINSVNYISGLRTLMLFLSLQELKFILNENINCIYAMIDTLSEEELFKPHMRKWADEAIKIAVWEVYKFIHVNTVVPFGSF